ncbi:MAG: sigma-70 family RNA polymerase sigma factor, partial [Planctomycetota bacterium]
MEEIVRQTRKRLLATARRIGAPQDAEDSVQATYYALLRRGDRPLDAPLIAWLLTVVVRIAYRRKAIVKKQAEVAERLARPSDEAGPLRRAESTERGEILREEVARLPAKYRDVLVLRYFEGLSRAECSALLDVPENTVKTRLQRGRQLLRGRLHPRMRHALVATPWFVSDAANAALSVSAMGVVMKSKVTVFTTVVALLVLAGLIGVATDLFRRGDGEARPRVDPAASTGTQVERGDKSPETESDEVEPSEFPLPESFDLDSADRDRDVHGFVVAEDGTPIPGAHLSLIHYPWRRSNTLNVAEYHSSVAGPKTRSAQDGSFVLPWERGRNGELLIEAEGFARRRFADVQAGERVRIVMDTGATVNVTVVAPVAGADAPVAGVEMLLHVAGGRTAGPWAHRGTSDADGEAQFTNVAGNRRVWIEAHHPEYGRPSWERVELGGSGEEISVRLRMRERRAVTGRVTDSVTGAPIAGAMVGLHWVQRDAVFTDDDGRYELSAWRSDEVLSVCVSADGYGRERAEFGTAGSSDTIDFELSPGDRVTGRVVDETGRALEGVRIAAIGAVMRERTLNSRGYAVSRADGRFEFGGLRHDAQHTLVLMTRGRGRALFDFGSAEQAG